MIYKHPLHCNTMCSFFSYYSLKLNAILIKGLDQFRALKGPNFENLF